MKRKEKIYSTLGFYYGLKYRIAYALHKKTYIKCIGKWLQGCQLLVMETHEWLLPESHMDSMIIEKMMQAGFSMRQLGENKIFSRIWGKGGDFA